MYMNCVYCGQSLPAEAAFCSRCGSSSPFQNTREDNSNTRSLPDTIPWAVETCEIGWTRRAQGFTARITFHAETTTFGDKHIIANSEPLPDLRDKIGGNVFIPRQTAEAVTAVSFIVDTLLRDGWQLAVSPMGYWWNYHFIRPIRP